MAKSKKVKREATRKPAKSSSSLKKPTRKKRRKVSTPLKAKGRALAQARAKTRTKTAQSRKSDVVRGAEKLFKTKLDFSSVSKFFSDRKAKAALDRRLKQEAPHVRNFAKRAIARGQTPAKAISQGTILHRNQRIRSDGTLKGSG